MTLYISTVSSHPIICYFYRFPIYLLIELCDMSMSHEVATDFYVYIAISFMCRGICNLMTDIMAYFSSASLKSHLLWDRFN